MKWNKTIATNYSSANSCSTKKWFHSLSTWQVAIKIRIFWQLLLVKNKKVSYRYKTASKDFELNVSKWRIFWLTPKRHQWPPNCFKKWFLSVMPNKIYTWLASHSHKFSEFFNSIFGGMGAVFPPCRWYFLYWCCEGRHFDIRTLYPSPRAPIDQYIARRSEHEKNFKY
jgi:hypothetical protein